MKKLFTLIATALMAVSVNAQTDATTYDFAGITEDRVTVNEHGEKNNRALDGVDCPCVNYLAADNNKKMLVQIKDIDLLTIQYSNSGQKSPAITFAEKFLNLDQKNFVLIIGTEEVKLKKDDVISVKFSAKGSKEAILHAETNLTGEDVKSKDNQDIQIASFTVGANGTAKIKETNGGARIYAMTINADIPAETTGISEFASAAKVNKARKVVVNGRLVIETPNGTFSATGARVK